MIRAIVTSLVIALAAGGAAATITRAKIFARGRYYIVRNTYWGGLLVQCPYCVSHWLVFAMVALYRPHLVTSDVRPIDVTVTAFAIIALATAIAALTCRTWWKRQDDV